MRKLVSLVLFLLFLNSDQTQSKIRFSQFNVASASSETSSLPVLRVSIKDNVYSDETVVAFKDGYAASYQTADGDAPYMSGAAITISSLTSDNKSMAINLMPDITDVKEVKLNVNARTSRVAEMTFTELPSEEYQFILKDTYLNIEKVLTKNASYIFTMDKAIKASFGSERFLLVIKPLIEPQPVDENLDKIKLSFFPNPTANTLFIESDLSSNLIETAIYTISGELRKKLKTSTKDLSIDVSDLLSGTYIITVNDAQTGEQVARSKFLKQ